jgi:hypothetical protein
VGIRELIGNIAFLQPSDSLYRDVVKGRVVPQRQQDGEALVDLRQLQRELEQRGHWRSLQEGRATLVALERLQRHGAEQQRQAAEQLQQGEEQLRQGVEQLRSQEVAQQEILELMVDAMQPAQVSTQAVEAMRLVQQRAQQRRVELEARLAQQGLRLAQAPGQSLAGGRSCELATSVARPEP